MADEGLFLTEDYIKANTLIDSNVDGKYLRITIADAQRIHMIPILGTALYNELSTQILAGTVTTLNRTLLRDYIWDALKYWVIVEGIDIFTYKVTNKSISKKDSDNSQPIDQDDVIRLMERNRGKAELFSERITKYLIENETSFPLFCNPGNGYDTVYPNRNNYTTGWNLDDVTLNYKNIDYGRLNYE